MPRLPLIVYTWTPLKFSFPKGYEGSKNLHQGELCYAFLLRSGTLLESKPQKYLGSLQFSTFHPYSSKRLSHYRRGRDGKCSKSL